MVDLEKGGGVGLLEKKEEAYSAASTSSITLSTYNLVVVAEVLDCAVFTVAEDDGPGSCDAGGGVVGWIR